MHAARTYGVRIIGPNCLGIMHPGIGLNATLFNGNVKAGNPALISRSGALCTAILDWAPPNDIGFSSVASMGTAADIDFGEIFDYLASDFLWLLKNASPNGTARSQRSTVR